MAIRKIVTLDEDNPILRQKARPVKRVTPEIRQLMDDMLETMRAAPGVGLAAPQVNVPLRVIVVEVPRDMEDPEAGTIVYALANPEIVRKSRETEEGEEGCLSIPGVYGYVERAKWVSVRALGRNGRRVRIRAEGFLARVLQHEIDHLNGILFIDHITDPEKLWTVEPEEAAEEKETAAEEPVLMA
jgi:peptide deformylase